VNDVFRVVDCTTHIQTESPAARAMRDGRIVELELGSVIVREDGSELSPSRIRQHPFETNSG
jgi:hypothetical protein